MLISQMSMHANNPIIKFFFTFILYDLSIS